MPRDLILHIGTSKTGSTSIQRVLSRRRKEMLAQGVVYPRSPGFERHGYLPMAATTDRKRVYDSGKLLWKGVSPEARLTRFRHEFDEELRALPGNVHRIVISAEQFSMILLDRQSVQNLYDMLAPHADRMTVVVWLRRPDQHYASLFSQMLRWGEVHPAGLARAKVMPAHSYDYHGLLDRWASVFGETAIKPQVFERVPGQHFDVVKDFLAVCGLELKPVVATAADHAASNLSLSHAAQVVLYQLALRICAGKRANVSSMLWTQIVEAASVALPGRSWQPTRAEAMEFVARYAENHEAVRRRWFPQRDSLFSLDFSDLPEKAASFDRATLIEFHQTLVLALARKAVVLQDTVAQNEAQFAEQAGDDVRLHRILSRRLMIAPNDIGLRLKMAELLRRTDDLAGARRQIDAILKIDPTHQDALKHAAVLPPDPEPPRPGGGSRTKPIEPDQAIRFF